MGKNRGFKTIKKQGTDETCYEVPEQLLYAAGIQMISESGIIKRDNTYDKAYYCEENSADANNAEKIKGCTMLLRSADVDFAFYEECSRNKVVLLIRFVAKSFEEAKEAFRILENDMQSNLYTFGITLHPMAANERLCKMHKLIMSDTPAARMDVNSYLSSKWLSWLSDMEMKNRVDEKKWLRVKETGELRCVFYVRRMSSEHAADVYRLVKTLESCKLLVTCYEPIEDRFVEGKTRQEYFSAEGICSNLIRKNHGIGRIMSGSDENERRYIFAGLYFVLEAADEETLLKVKHGLHVELKKYCCEIAEFPCEQKDVYRQLLTFRPWTPAKTNLILTQKAVKMNPFFREKQREQAYEEEENTLLRLFDKML